MGYNRAVMIRIQGGLMPVRPLLIVAFALFFAALVPMALACEVAAQGGASCVGAPCKSFGRVEHCAGERAAIAATLAKPDADRTAHLPLASSHAAPASAFHAHRTVAPERVPPHGAPPALPSTLVALAVLLRI